MNARQLNYALGALALLLLVLNSITLALLRRERAEVTAWRVRKGQRPRVASEPSKLPATPPAAGGGAPLTATQSVSILLREVNQENRLRQVYDIKDGITAPASIDGVACRELTRPGELAKIHFTVDPSFKTGTPFQAWVEVEYFDAAPNGGLSLEYDGPQPYTPSERRVRLKNSSEWKQATFELTEAAFTGRQNGGADFRIIATRPKVFVRRVTVRRE